MSDMSYEDASAELDAAIAADAAPAPLEQPAVAPTTPEGESTPTDVQPHHASTQPRDPTSGKFIRPDGTLSDTPEPVAPVEDTFDGGKFNPDTLAPELQPAWKQLQAEYTRKTQQIAEERKQFEGIDPAQAREAVELFQALQNPDYLVQFHGELSKALVAQGLTPGEARAAAAQLTEEAATTPSINVSDKLAALREDPDLAPVADYLAALEEKSSTALSRLDKYEQEQQLREEQAAIRSQQMAQAAEVQRQEMAIRHAHPEYTDETSVEDGEVSDMDGIYALSAWFDGNLLEAEQFYAKLNEAAVQRYVNKKQSANELPGASTLPSGAETTSELPTPIASLDEAHKSAAEFLAASGIDTIG